MRIIAKTVLSGVKLNNSIVVNGTCLTVTHFDPEAFHFTVGLSLGTLRRTSLRQLVVGSLDNLERVLLSDSNMRAHFVQGHVDATEEIISLVPEGRAALGREGFQFLKC